MDGFKSMTDVPFLDKEAARFNPFRGFLNRGARSPHTSEAMGKFVTDPASQVGAHNAEDIRALSGDEIEQIIKDDRVGNGTGGLFGDLSLGGVKLISPGVREKTDDVVNNVKSFIEKWDTKGGEKLIGKKDVNSKWGKFMSTPTGTKQGGEGIPTHIKTNADGSKTYLSEGAGGQDRRPSLLGPVSNTLKVTTPFMAAGYAGEKLYPNDPQPSYNSYYDPRMAKKSSGNDSNEQEKHGILEEETRSLYLDKEASLQKIAQLEDELEKKGEEVESLSHEISLLTKEASAQKARVFQLERDLEMEKKAMMEKEEVAEEFRLRTIARDRSKIATDIAEGMLEEGIIKQAQLQNKIDEMMDCNEETLNLYASLVKEAKKEEEGLESLAYLVDYRSNDTDILPSDPNDRGLSKRGQTIGEAAEDLLR